MSSSIHFKTIYKPVLSLTAQTGFLFFVGTATSQNLRTPINRLSSDFSGGGLFAFGGKRSNGYPKI